MHPAHRGRHRTAAGGSGGPWAGLLLAVTALLAAFPLSARSELVDHIAAAVNNEVITASEFAQTVALNERFGRAGKAERSSLAAETLQGLTTRRLLVQEARRLRFVEVAGQEIRAEVDRFKQQFPSPDAFADFLTTQGMTERELGHMLGERLLVERFVEKKVGLFVRVDREEAQNYFDAHAAAFAGKRFQDAQKSITAVLTEQKIALQLEQYVAELRSRADIRINPSNVGVQ